MDTSVNTIDAYIEGYPKEIQKLLNQMRKTIKKAAPKATEAIKYGIPTYVLEGNLIHFGGAKNHIGLYPGSSTITTFQKKLKGYKTSKGTIQFPIDEPLPLDLVTEITKFRIKENLEHAALKKAKGK